MRPPGPVTRTCMPPTESPKWSPIACTESRKASSPGLPSRLANRSAPLPSGEYSTRALLTGSAPLLSQASPAATTALSACVSGAVALYTTMIGVPLASGKDAKGTPIIVVYSATAPLTQADKAVVAAGEVWLKSGAEPVNSARVEYSPDGKGALLFASLDGNPGDEAFRDSVQAIGDHFGDSVGGMQVRVTGPGGLITDVYRIFLNADVKLLIGTVILVLILLLVIYRSPVLPFVPLLAVGFGYFVAGGILALIATALGVTLSGQATSLMVILLFGAGTDYGLLLISRYREMSSSP